MGDRPGLTYFYDQHFYELARLGEVADRERWTSEKFGAEAARLNAKFVILLQGIDAQQRDRERNIEAARQRGDKATSILRAAIQAYAESLKRPPVVTTTCSTLGGVTTCTTR